MEIFSSLDVMTGDDRSKFDSGLRGLGARFQVGRRYLADGHTDRRFHGPIYKITDPSTGQTPTGEMRAAIVRLCDRCHARVLDEQSGWTFYP